VYAAQQVSGLALPGPSHGCHRAISPVSTLRRTRPKNYQPLKHPQALPPVPQHAFKNHNKFIPMYHTLSTEYDKLYQHHLETFRSKFAETYPDSSEAGFTDFYPAIGVPLRVPALSALTAGSPPKARETQRRFIISGIASFQLMQ